MTVKLTALQGFVSAVANDWEFIRKKRALMRLDEIQESLKKLDQTASVSEVINLLPSDLPRVYNTVWKFLAILTPDYVPRPATDGEVSMSSFFRNPLVAPLLPLTFDNVRKQIQTTPIPEGMKATVYVDQLFDAEFREALRRAFSSPRKPT